MRLQGYFKLKDTICRYPSHRTQTDHWANVTSCMKGCPYRRLMSYSHPLTKWVMGNWGICVWSHVKLLSPLTTPVDLPLPYTNWENQVCVCLIPSSVQVSVHSQRCGLWTYWVFNRTWHTTLLDSWLPYKGGCFWCAQFVQTCAEWGTASFSGIY